ncbi:MAG TPA: hypothetical protein VF267_00760, partial [Gammaproteobacteria bacterium]
SYAGTWQSIENECAKALNKTSIHAAPEVGRFDAVYSCGALINRLVGEVVNPENPGEGIIEFWQAMAAWPESDRKVESEKLFFRTLEKLGFGDEQRTVLRNFLDLQADEPQTAIERVRATLKDTE